MQRASHSIEGRGPSRWRPVAGWVGLVGAFALAWLAWVLWSAPADADRAETARQAASVLAWCLLAVAMAFGLGWGSATALWRLRHAASLREARDEAQTITQLLDVWHWQTDAEHRLLHWQPPRDAPESAWDGRATGLPLWQRFDSAAAQALQARMNAAAPLEDLLLTHAASATQHGGTPWRLRGVPRFDALGRFAGYVGTARCLDAERELGAARDSVAALLASAAGPVFIIDNQAPAGLRQANAAAARLIGVEPVRNGSMAGISLAELMARLPGGLRDAANAALAGTPTAHGEWQLQCERSGSGRPMVLSLLPRVIEPVPAGLEASDQEAFNYTVSHDLRAPIRVVEGFARILKEDYGGALDRIGNDHLDRVLGAASRMNNMIDAMLALARLSSLPLARQAVSLTQLAGVVIEDLQREHPGREVQVRVQAQLVAQGDPTLLRIALENLLGNAWKYSAKRAPAVISFERARHNGRDAYVVRDNGAGFDMRFADRLFGAFQRLHSANDFAGTGVGLASVQRIIRRHGGEVWAESEIGQGARFYFTLK